MNSVDELCRPSPVEPAAYGRKLPICFQYLSNPCTGAIVSETAYLGDPRVDAVLGRLHRQARSQLPQLLRHYLFKLPKILLKHPLDWQRDAPFYADKLIPIEPQQGRLLYLLARAAQARRIVEFGTSFGVSTLYLAAAVRDNGGGTVIGSEIESAKITAARANLREAGLTAYVELREGDARTTLANLGPAQVDLLLLDGWADAALPVLKTVEPSLRDGALVVADNVDLFRADLADLVAHLSIANSYRPLRLSLKGCTLIAVKETAS